MSSTHRHLLLDLFWQVISGPPCIIYILHFHILFTNWADIIEDLNRYNQRNLSFYFPLCQDLPALSRFFSM
jgi:hypothetical protein